MQGRRAVGIGVGVLLVSAAAWLAIPYSLLPRFRAPLTATPADVGLAFETVTVETGSPPVSLVGWWMPTDRTAPARAVAILLHDGGSNRSFLWSQALGLARELSTRGFDVLAPDLRGHGESERGGGSPPVGGDLAPDVSAWIDFAESRAGRLPVVVVGFGLGGQVAIYAAAADARIVAVVADSTWADLRSSLLVSLPRATPLPRALLPPLLWCAEHVYGVDFARSRAVDAAPAVGDRLLLIENEADPQVPLRQLRWLAHAARGSEVWLTPAPLPDHPVYATRGSWGTHTQSYPLDPEGYTARVVRFVEARLALARPRAHAQPDGEAGGHGGCTSPPASAASWRRSSGSPAPADVRAFVARNAGRIALERMRRRPFAGP